MDDACAGADVTGGRIGSDVSGSDPDVGAGSSFGGRGFSCRYSAAKRHHGGTKPERPDDGHVIRPITGTM
jgi:hypothetical protein